MNRRTATLFVGLLAVGPFASWAQGQTTAFSFEALPENVASAPGTDGFRFDTTVDIQVTDLGYYDAGEDGLVLEHNVGIYEFDSRELLTSATVADSSYLDGPFRYTPIDPLTLYAGTSYIVAGYHSGDVGDLIGQFDVTRLVDTASEVNMEGYYFDESAELVFPQTSYEPFRVFGPNFRFVTSGDISAIDFNSDGRATCADINSLATAVANDTPQTAFDLNKDFQLDVEDIEIWLTRAGVALTGSPFENGDANLDGSVNAADYATWETHRFSSGTWCQGDFNADGQVGGSDFNIWNVAQRNNASVAAVPEPQTAPYFLLLVVVWLIRRVTRSSGD